MMVNESAPTADDPSGAESALFVIPSATFAAARPISSPPRALPASTRLAANPHQRPRLSILGVTLAEAFIGGTRQSGLAKSVIPHIGPTPTNRPAGRIGHLRGPSGEAYLHGPIEMSVWTWAMSVRAGLAR